MAAEAKSAEAAAARAAAEAAALAPYKQLAAALTLRGYKLTLPEVKVGARKPYVDAADGSVHWPVLLMYPETGQQDVIEDWHEEDTVDAHLDVVGVVLCSAVLVTIIIYDVVQRGEQLYSPWVDIRVVSNLDSMNIMFDVVLCIK